jgi:hypothetical protein
MESQIPAKRGPICQLQASKLTLHTKVSGDFNDSRLNMLFEYLDTILRLLNLPAITYNASVVVG